MQILVTGRERRRGEAAIQQITQYGEIHYHYMGKYKIIQYGEIRNHSIWGNTLSLTFSFTLQLTNSSQAKHGGAYFSAVSGSIKDPIAVPGWHEVPGVQKLVGSAQPVTFVLPTNMHRLPPLLRGPSRRICSETGLMYLFDDKYMRPVSEQILLECQLRSGSCMHE